VDTLSSRRLFLWLLLPLLGFRLWFAAVLPITGDEAYFYWWGKIPDWGFYDHPPMIGWWLALQLQFGEPIWWLRLTSVLQPFVLAGAVVFMLPRIWPDADPERRWWAALFVLLAPASVWNVLITTDIPLVYFSVFSGLAWLRARSEAACDSHYGWYLLAGLFLAGAVLSKYFVAFLGFAFLADALWHPTRRKLSGLAIAYACVVPALALMAWWNANHCWPNFMFNFVNRHGGAGLSWQTPLLYMVTMAYLLTPPLAWRLVRLPGTADRGQSLVLLCFVPLALFALLSLVKTIGLHWVLSFLPFAFMLLALKLERPALVRVGRFMLGFAVLHAVLLLAVSQFPLETWRKAKPYSSAVLTFEGEEIARRLKPYEKDYVFASSAYSDAVTLGFNSKHYFLVFGEASSHARHDDILTDFRVLDQRNILILRKRAPQPGEYAAFFREVHEETFELRGATFHMVLGQGFNYPRYREKVLSVVRHKYYAIPGWLPQASCYFGQRYFPEDMCCR
jgi:hypothetical protein